MHTTKKERRITEKFRYSDIFLIAHEWDGCNAIIRTQSPMPSSSASRCDLREPRSSLKFLASMIFVDSRRVAKLSSVCIRTYVRSVQPSCDDVQVSESWKGSKTEQANDMLEKRKRQISVDSGHGSNSQPNLNLLWFAQFLLFSYRSANLISLSTFMSWQLPLL
jgi:hypothetical protein